MTIYVKVVNTATIRIEEEALAKSGLTMDDLHGYPVRDLEEHGVEYELEVEDEQWETRGTRDAVYQHPKPEVKAVPTNSDLRRMVFTDQGDSKIMRLPDGTQRMTGYTAEGPPDENYERALRRIYDEWKAAQS